MPVYLGIDTSNYATSAALYDSTKRSYKAVKRFLQVNAGERGLRQSDALFLHSRQLPKVMEELFVGFSGTVSAVGVSAKPRDEEQSYMPCFLAGVSAASAVAAASHVPLYRSSHQNGHAMAALFGAGREKELLESGCYLFHVSGGTTELLAVQGKDDGGLSVKRLAGTLDLNAGQLIDRIGVTLGLSFPAGPELEKLAAECDESIRVRPVLKDLNPCLSGFENKAETLLREGKSPEYTAKYVLCAVLETLSAMTAAVVKEQGILPVVYAGGVMSNLFLKEKLTARHGGITCPPELSADNAVGAALLAARKEEHLG